MNLNGKYFLMRDIILNLLRMTRKRFIEDKSRFPYKKESKLHIFRYVASVPLLKNNNKYFFDSVGKQGSKSYGVYTELLNVLNCSKKDIFVSNKSVFWFPVIRFLRILFRIPCIFFILYEFRNTQVFDKNDIAIILGFIFFKDFFEKNPNISPVVLSDVNPGLALLAASSCKNGYVWWQEDFHHIQVPPFKPKKLIFLTQRAKDNAEKVGIKGLFFMRSKQKFSKITHNLKREELKVSFAVNGFFSASSSEIEKIMRIIKLLNVSKVSIRLHPTAKLEDVILPSCIEICPNDQSIDSYVKNWNLFIVGNSAIQLKILSAGKHVIHTSGLDPHGFDLYGYCDKNIVFGEEEFDINILKKLNSFYLKENYLENIADVY